MQQSTLYHMVEQVKNGQVEYGQTNGFIHKIGSSYPDWFKELKTSQVLFDRAVEIILLNEIPTPIQDLLIMKIEIVADLLESTQIELMDCEPMTLSEIARDRIENVIYLQPEWAT